MTYPGLYSTIYLRTYKRSNLYPAYNKPFDLLAEGVQNRIGWETGIRTPIRWSRAIRLTIRRSPSAAPYFRKTAVDIQG